MLTILAGLVVVIALVLTLQAVRPGQAKLEPIRIPVRDSRSGRRGQRR